MSKIGSWLCVLLALISGYTLYCGNAELCIAQSDDIIWSKPLNLSNTPQSSGNPAIVADSYGYVHVFWSEEVAGEAMRPEDMGRSGNTILYTRWDGANWTAPVDILFVPSEQIADFVAVDVDTENRLHAIWTGQSNFYYSNAPSWQADSAHVWSTPIILASDSARSAWESDIMADASGGLHVIYSKRGDMPGIYHIRSLDGGQTWSEAVRLSEPFGPLERSFCHVKIIADGMGYLHAVWQTTQDEGYGQAVYYARSVDNGEHWSAPWQFGYRDPGDTFVEWPYLTAYGVSEIHLIYIDGGTQGRLHRISLDNGRTWSGSHHIIPELEGVNGYVIPVVDGAGNMHLIANMRTRAGQLVGIYYARWNRNSWSPTIPIDNSSAAASSAHYTAATVRLGNEIYIVYNQLQGSEIWLLRGMLSSVKPLPTAELPSPIEPTLAAPAVNNVPAVSEVISRPSQPSPDWRTQPYEQSSGGEILLFSLGTSVLLVGGVMIWMRVHNRRQICRERKF